MGSKHEKSLGTHCTTPVGVKVCTKIIDISNRSRYGDF